jgi:Asp-tRNA(Asn)/Glu-tRNA(Gln) amidotransferase A subunit family amidase
VGLVRTHKWKNAPQYAKDALEDFFRKLSKERGIKAEEANIPKAMERTHEIHERIYNKALSYYFKGEHKKSDFVSPIMNYLIDSGNKITIKDYMQAISDQNELIRKMDSFFKDYDIIISLSTAGEAPPREVTELPDPALMWTLTHLPVVSVPIFHSPSGMPFGIQIVARKYNDYLLFSFLDELGKLKLIPEHSTFFK